LPDNYTAFDSLLVSTGAPIAEYSVALGLAFLGRQLDRTKHRTLKEVTKFASSLMSWAPFLYSEGSLITQSGDYQNMANLGLNFYVTIPATFLMGTVITYYNFIEQVPTLENHLNDAQKEEITQQFTQKLEETGYTPSIIDNLRGKIKNISPLEARADKLSRSLLKTEISEDGTISLRHKQKKVYADLFATQENTMEFVSRYLPIAQTT